MLNGTAAPIRNPFQFFHRLNTLERDRIVVLARWRRWGKIRDGFDVKMWRETWERDLSSHAGINLDNEAGARNGTASILKDQGLKVRILTTPIFF